MNLKWIFVKINSLSEKNISVNRVGFSFGNHLYWIITAISCVTLSVSASECYLQLFAEDC